MARILRFPTPHIPDPDCAICGTGTGLCQYCYERSPGRLMVKRRCQDCHWEWEAPSPEGDCPKCHSDQTENTGQQVNVLKRI